MSNGDTDKPKQEQLRVTERALGENEMYRVQRREVALHLEGASEADLQEFDEHLHDSGSVDVPFEMRLGRDLAVIEAKLDALGYPRAPVCVACIEADKRVVLDAAAPITSLEFMSRL